MIPPSMLRKVMEAAGEDEGIDTLIVIQILFYILYQMPATGWERSIVLFLSSVFNPNFLRPVRK